MQHTNDLYPFKGIQKTINLVRDFCEALRDEIDEHGHALIIAPDYDEYRLSVATAGTIFIETDLRLAAGVYLPVRARFFVDDAASQLDNVRTNFRSLLGVAFKKARAAERFRIDVAEEADRLAAVAKRKGVDFRILRVGLAPAILNGACQDLGVEIQIEGATCNMLRPYRETYRIARWEDLGRMIDEVSGHLKPIRRHRGAAIKKLGAAGYIDSIALSIVDTLPEGRRAILKQISRSFEYNGYTHHEDRPQGHGLRWYDGVVRAYSPLTPQHHRDWETISLKEPCDATVGESATTVCAHPALKGLLIEEVVDNREIRVTDRLFAFTAAGDILALA